jgi:SAM-dependent methyltransferase
VDQIYGDHYFCGGEAGYPDYLSEAEILLAHGKQYGLLLKRYMTPGTMLDVGAAAGFVLKGFQESGWRGIGLEPNPHMAEYARTQLGLRVGTSTLEQFQGHERYDLISMIQVVAHFYELRQAFQVAAEFTRPGGFWLIETWNRESFVARALGQHWHEYSPPSVLHWFSPEGLKRFVAQFGFFEIARGRPSKWLNGAHVKSLLGYKLQDSQLSWLASGLLDVIPDHLTIPYPTYDLFWILFQKT